MNNSIITETFQELKNNYFYFNGHQFEKQIPYNMRYKTYETVDDDGQFILHWITPDDFDEFDLQHFRDAAEDYLGNDLFNKIAITIRDFDKGYESNKKRKVLAWIYQDGSYDYTDYNNAATKQFYKHTYHESFKNIRTVLKK